MPRSSLGIKPDTEHLKLAFIERGCPRTIVIRLLWAEFSEIDRADPTVLAWAEKKREQGGRIGQWLLNHLRKSGNKDHEKVAIDQYKRHKGYSSI